MPSFLKAKQFLHFSCINENKQYSRNGRNKLIAIFTNLKPPFINLYNQYRNLADEDLLHRMALRDDKEAFSVLYDRYKHIALGVCLNNLEAETSAREVVQDVFLQVWTSCRKAPVAEFRPWFAQILNNHCQLKLQQLGRKSNIKEIRAECVSNDDNLQLRLNEDRLLSMLNACLGLLDEEQRTCVQLFYVDRKSYSETAAAMKVSPGEVKQRIQSALRHLKACLYTKINVD